MLPSAKKTAFEKSICKSLSVPHPPAALSALMIASLRSDFGTPETSAVHGCGPLKIPPPGAVGGADGFGDNGADDDGAADEDDDDAVFFAGESESPLNMTTAATATITTRSAAAEASSMFLRRPDDGVDGGVDGGPTAGAA